MLQLLVVLLFSLFRDNVSPSKRNMGFSSWTMQVRETNINCHLVGTFNLL